MLQELTVKEVERLSNLKIPNKVEIEKVLEMMVNGKEPIKCKIKTYRNGREMLVVYKYDRELNRYCIYHAIQLD